MTFFSYRQRGLGLCYLVAVAGGWLWLGVTGLGLMLLGCHVVQHRQLSRAAASNGRNRPPPVDPLPWVWMMSWAVVYPTAKGGPHWIFADELSPFEYAQLRREYLSLLN